MHQLEAISSTAIAEYGFAAVVLVVIVGALSQVIIKVADGITKRTFGQLEAQTQRVEKLEARHDATTEGFRLTVEATTQAMQAVTAQLTALNIRTEQAMHTSQAWRAEIREKIEQQNANKKSDHQTTIEKIERVTELIRTQQRFAEAEFKATQEQNRMMLQYLHTISVSLQLNPPQKTLISGENTNA